MIQLYSTAAGNEEPVAVATGSCQCSEDDGEGLFANATLFVRAESATAADVCGRLDLAGSIRPPLNEVSDDNAADHKEDREHYLDSIGENAEVFTEVADANIAKLSN